MKERSRARVTAGCLFGKRAKARPSSFAFVIYLPLDAKTGGLISSFGDAGAWICAMVGAM